MGQKSLIDQQEWIRADETIKQWLIMISTPINVLV